MVFQIICTSLSNGFTSHSNLVYTSFSHGMVFQIIYSNICRGCSNALENYLYFYMFKKKRLTSHTVFKFRFSKRCRLPQDLIFLVSTDDDGKNCVGTASNFKRLLGPLWYPVSK